jgi:hypothetical protein
MEIIWRLVASESGSYAFSMNVPGKKSSPSIDVRYTQVSADGQTGTVFGMEKDPSRDPSGTEKHTDNNLFRWNGEGIIPVPGD